MSPSVQYPAPLRWTALGLVLGLLCGTITADAHRSGCHRWHSCPSDTGSYICGDLGYCAQCPDNQYCVGGEPRPTTEPLAPKAAEPQVVAQFAGQVVGITDGDTLTVLHRGVGEKIRLHGIDCPEKGQPFGRRAKQFTSIETFGDVVIVESHGPDRFGRMIGTVILRDDHMLNHELVKAGLAWWYRRYGPEDTVLEQYQREAREAKRGLWSQPNPMPPWEFRKRRKG